MKKKAIVQRKAKRKLKTLIKQYGNRFCVEVIATELYPDYFIIEERLYRS